MFNKLKQKNFDPVTNFDKLFEKYIGKGITNLFLMTLLFSEEYKNKKNVPDFTIQ